MFSNMSFKFGSYSSTRSSSCAKMKSFYSSLVEEKGGLLVDSSNISAEKTNYYVVLDDDVENTNHNNVDDNDNNHTNNHTNDSNNNNSDINNIIIISRHWIADCVTANGLVPVQKYLVAPPSGRPQFIYEMKTVSKSFLDQDDDSPNSDMIQSFSIPSDLSGSTNPPPPEDSSLDIYLQILAQKRSMFLNRPANDLIEGIAGIRGCVFSLSGFPKRRISSDSLVPDKGELEQGIRLAGGRVGKGSYYVKESYSSLNPNYLYLMILPQVMDAWCRELLPILFAHADKARSLMLPLVGARTRCFAFPLLLPLE